MPKTPILYDDEREIELPFRWIICDDCRGHGKSSAYLGAFTGDQMREDPDFAEEYMSGGYDRCCDACNGSGKVKAVDEKRTPKPQLERFRQQQQDDAEINAIHRQERLMEGGWREMGWYGH